MAVVIPYVVQTWTDGVSSGSAARFGVIEQGITDAHNMPAARAFNSAAQTITTATVTALTFDSERYDTDTIHDTVTNNSRLTCKHAGVYEIVGHMGWAVSAAGTFRQMKLRVNGATVIATGTGSPSASHGSEMAVPAQWKMAVNDYVELTVQQDSGGNLTVSGELMMCRVATG
jgi:hypothetical protein